MSCIPPRNSPIGSIATSLHTRRRTPGAVQYYQVTSERIAGQDTATRRDRLREITRGGAPVLWESGATRSSKTAAVRSGNFSELLAGLGSINPQTGQPSGMIVDPTQCTVVGTTRTCTPS